MQRATDCYKRFGVTVERNVGVLPSGRIEHRQIIGRIPPGPPAATGVPFETVYELFEVSMGEGVRGRCKLLILCGFLGTGGGPKTACNRFVPTVIQLREVRAGYRRNSPVLDRINVAINQGELVAILGSSGVGKSTLLRVISGLLPPQGGSVTVLDRNVLDIRPRDRSIGFVFQNLALFPHLSVRDNVGFGLRFGNAGEEQREQQVRLMLESLSLSDLADRLPSQLSGGEAQRVAVARALAPQPQILLLDEPFSSLDRALANSAREIVTRVHREKSLTTLIVTHDWEQALTVADRILILGRNGRILQDSIPNSVYLRPATPEAASLSGPISLLSGVVRDISGRRMSVDVSGGTVEANWASGDDVPQPKALVLVAVRPEWITVDDRSASRYGITCRVIQVAEVGKRSYVHLALNGETVTAECDDISNTRSGMTVRAIIDSDFALAYPREGRTQ